MSVGSVFTNYHSLCFHGICTCFRMDSFGADPILIVRDLIFTWTVAIIKIPGLNKSRARV